MITLAHPWLLVLLPLPWLIWRYFPAHKERVSAIRVPFFRMLTDAAGEQPSQGATVLSRGRLQTIAGIAIWCLVVVGLARPEQLGEPVIIERSARDIVLALDISGSMDERDFTDADGNRLQRLAAVKDVMKTFIAARDGDRMALIVFGTRAFVQAPFTDDLASLDGFLDQTEVGMAGPNTAVGDAIGLAVRTFETSDVEERLIILLSDGADTSSRMTPVNAATIAADRGVVIQTIGVGDPEATGEDKVDLEALKDIATRTNGAFFFADDETALNEIYTRIDELNPRITQNTSYRPTNSLTWVAAAGALVTGLLALGLLMVRSRWRAA